MSNYYPQPQPAAYGGPQQPPNSNYNSNYGNSGYGNQNAYGGGPYGNAPPYGNPGNPYATQPGPAYPNEAPIGKALITK